MAPKDIDADENTLPGDYCNLNELAAPLPVKKGDDQQIYRHELLEGSRHEPRHTYGNSRSRSQDGCLEQRRSRESQCTRKSGQGQLQDLPGFAIPLPKDLEDQHSTTEQSRARQEPPDQSIKRQRVSRIATKIYTISHLILFSILGTLARLGLQSLTIYPGAPAQSGVLWANFAGSFVMGFLMEDRMLFREEWGKGPKADDHRDEEMKDAQKREEGDIEAAKKQHLKVKKTIPLFIGLTTGFCGSFTSFSSFIRDVFFALSNSLPVPVSHASTTSIDVDALAPRNGGYDFMAVVAMILLTVCVSLGALQGGVHLAIATEAYVPAIPFCLSRRILDCAVVFLAFGIWLGAIVMAIMPPQTHEMWRGEVLFALVFAPLGCLARFYASLLLNSRFPSFPLGTFAINISGTLLLGMLFDLQHSPLGGISGNLIGGGRVGCQVLQGAMDGFCGCLTTVSTWVVELKGLRMRHAYVYSLASILVGLAGLVAIMGSLKWTNGFQKTACAG